MKDGELPVLPLSVYGSVVMAHSAVSEELSSPNQFFFYLYDKRNVSKIFSNNIDEIYISSMLKTLNLWQAGLGGLSFDEGQFSVFGYVERPIFLSNRHKISSV